MTVEAAFFLMAVSLLGAAVSSRLLSDRKKARAACVTLFALAAAAFALYIGLALLFVGAVASRPPAP